MTVRSAMLSPRDLGVPTPRGPATDVDELGPRAGGPSSINGSRSAVTTPSTTHVRSEGVLDARPPNRGQAGLITVRVVPNRTRWAGEGPRDTREVARCRPARFRRTVARRIRSPAADCRRKFIHMSDGPRSGGVGRLATALPPTSNRRLCQQIDADAVLTQTLALKVLANCVPRPSPDASSSVWSDNRYPMDLTSLVTKGAAGASASRYRGGRSDTADPEAQESRRGGRRGRPPAP